MSLNVADAISHWARQKPDAIAIVEGDRRITYAAFDGAVWRAAAAWREAGISADRVVGLSLPRNRMGKVLKSELLRFLAPPMPAPGATAPRGNASSIGPNGNGKPSGRE